jgi:hypothetical protein
LEVHNREQSAPEDALMKIANIFQSPSWSICVVVLSLLTNRIAVDKNQAYT